MSSAESTPAMSAARQCVAEAVGTALLLATVVGSGIMGAGLSEGNDAIALLGNTLATGAILVVLIMMFGPISGAHFNPAVTLVMYLEKQLPAHLAAAFVFCQCIGGLAGVVTAHAMFELDLLQASTNTRTGGAQWLAEGVATFGLLATILYVVRQRADAVPFAVGLYITAGYWFTASTSFANPAVTLARSFTDTFSGIDPSDVIGFVLAQMAGALVAWVLYSWQFKSASPPSDG